LRRAPGSGSCILGSIAEREADLPTARACFEEALAMSRKGGNEQGCGWALFSLGRIATAQGDVRSGHAFLAEALTLHQELGLWLSLADMIEMLARDAVSQGRIARAAQLFGAAEARCEAEGFPPPVGEREAYERSVAIARAGLGESEFAAAWAEGKATALEQVCTYALQDDEAPPCESE
jgi:hypothetical protein